MKNKYLYRYTYVIVRGERGEEEESDMEFTDAFSLKEFIDQNLSWYVRIGKIGIIQKVYASKENLKRKFTLYDRYLFASWMGKEKEYWTNDNLKKRLEYCTKDD